ncbi:MAG: diaminopimelate epimerase [Planctomycetota bacterium]
MARILEVDGAGNRFVLWDARAGGAPVDPVGSGLALCAASSGAFAGAGADGMLLVLPAEGAAAARLVIINRDGSRPEMCGNGLRCLARYLAEGFLLAPASEVPVFTFVVETDAGPLDCRAACTHGEWVVAVRLGHATVGEAFSVPFPGVTRGVPAFSVQVGNPHAVLDGSHLGARLEDVPLASVAEAVLATGRFPAGVNVEVAEVHGDHVRARVFERGVGETQACGTGAAAIAAVAIEHLGLGAPVRVHMPGGVLVVHQAADGKGGGDDQDLWLSGPVRLGATLEVPLGAH